MKLRKDYTCPLEIVHDIIKGKWKPIILFQLKDGAKSLSQLQKEINGITQKMLIEQLSELKQYGIISKNKALGYPLHVEYFLTEDKGQQMLKAIRIMQNVGIDYMNENGMEDIIKAKGIKKLEI